MEIPLSAAAERNKGPILEVLKEIITPNYRHVFEVGAGTGQHAAFFAAELPRLTWTPSERDQNMSMLNKAVQETRVRNLLPPKKFEVGQDRLPKKTYDVFYTANTFHIMHWKECKTLMKDLAGALDERGLVLIYGPFNYRGEFTSDSNKDFDASLKSRDPLSGIRSFEDVEKAMAKNGFELIKDYEMPANNRLLAFARLKFERK